MAAVTKIDISFLVYCCCIISKNVTAGTWHLGTNVVQEEFEDTKVLIRICKSKKNRQDNI